VKLLPFDDKAELAVVFDLPHGAAVEDTDAVAHAVARVALELPEVDSVQTYAATAAPFNFNGLVRHYFLRADPNQGDVQINLGDRQRASHDIARAARPALAEVGKRHGAASVQVVEVPPGPPVLAPLVAEIYGPDYEAQRELARELRRLFDTTADIIDVDDSVEADAERLVVSVDRQKAALLGINQQTVVETLAAALGGLDATYMRVGGEKYPVGVRVELPVAEKADIDRALALRVRSDSGATVPLAEITRVERVAIDPVIHRKDGARFTFVSGDGGGRLDSPLYGMFELVDRVERERPAGRTVEQNFISQPDGARGFAIKWDGEWTITYETFRDMGLAYAVGLILIYLLVVGQFGSYAVPLVIMAPIPLTLIGIMPGHALLGAQFTATSMIGMIALAGIIVRNSILLVDFINVELAAGRELADAVISAGAVRAKPIALTAAAAMLGAFFILDDPIFNGLAVSLIFGIFVSTLLTLILIPVLYYSYRRRFAPAGATSLK